MPDVTIPAPEAVTKQSKSAFFTRQRANEGIKLPLSTPTGEKTDHWIQIRGVDSDAYRLAMADFRRRIFSQQAELATEPGKLDAVKQDEELVLLSHLVIAWSFVEDDGSPSPLTQEAVMAFLREAPQIAKQIDNLSTRRALFFGDSLKPSTSSPAPTSS